MIKGIAWMRTVGAAAEFETLRDFFSALGFEPGRAWERKAMRGAPFRAPLGEIELLEGTAGLPAEILIEVTELDDLHRAVKDWLAARGGAIGTEGQAKRHVSDVEPTSWKSRLFSVEPVPGWKLAFWEWADPLAGKPLAIEGDLSAAGMRFGIVVARWNAVITERLLQGALDGLLRSGAERQAIEIVRVPGAWEIPSAARAMAESKAFDGVITLGCLLRGETAHYEAIYNEVSRGIGQSQQETGVPHGFGVLTCETLEQALNRAGVKAGNKGFEAAVATIEMVSVHRQLSHRKLHASGVAGAEDERPA